MEIVSIDIVPPVCSRSRFTPFLIMAFILERFLIIHCNAMILETKRVGLVWKDLRQTVEISPLVDVSMEKRFLRPLGWTR